MAYGGMGNFRFEPSRTCISQSTSDPLNITLGIELEFILAVSTYPDKASFENADEGIGQSLVRYALSQPMVGLCTTCGIHHIFQLPVHTNSNVDYENRYDYWDVKDDTSLFLSKDEQQALGEGSEYFHFYEIEVTSRILRPTRNLATSRNLLGHVHEITYAQEIDAVVNRLLDFFSGLKRGNKVERAHIIVNRQCGLHIHVGNEHRGFPLPTVKKVLSTYVANERPIDGLHAGSRIGGSKLATMPSERPRLQICASDITLAPPAYNCPWSMYFASLAYTLGGQRRGYSKWISRSKSALPYPSDQSPWVYPETHMDDAIVGKSVDSFQVVDWLNIIDCAPSLFDLKQLQGGFFGRPTLNIRNLAEYDSDGLMPDVFDKQEDEIPLPLFPELMTLEFRQHAGTLDSAAIHAWIDVVVSMVKHAHFTADADFRNISRNEWLRPNQTSLIFLNDIGCSGSTILHYHQRLVAGQQSQPAGGSVFAADAADTDLFPVDAMIAPLLEYLEWKRQQDCHPAVIKSRIKEKFHIGGYGKFNDEYLDQLDLIRDDLYDPHLGLREKLSTGSERCR